MANSNRISHVVYRFPEKLASGIGVNGLKISSRLNEDKVKQFH